MDEWTLHKSKDHDSNDRNSSHGQVQLRLRQSALEHHRAEQVPRDLTARVYGPEEPEIHALCVVRRATAKVRPLRHPDERTTEATDHTGNDRGDLNEAAALQEDSYLPELLVLLRWVVCAPARQDLRSSEAEMASGAEYEGAARTKSGNDRRTHQSRHADTSVEGGQTIIAELFESSPLKNFGRHILHGVERNKCD